MALTLERVQLNSKWYRIRNMQIGPARNWGEVIAQVGGQTREARTGTPQWDLTPHKGMGQELITKLSDLKGIFVDSTAETRWSDFITLSGLWVAETSWTPHHKASPQTTDQDIIGGINFDNEIWMFHGQTVGAAYRLLARRYNESTEDSDTTETIYTTASSGVFVPQTACVHGAFIFVIFQGTGAGGGTLIRKRAIGGAITTPTMTGLTPGAEVNDSHLLTSIGNRLYCAQRIAATNVVNIFYSTDNGDNWTAGATSIVSAARPTGFCGAYNGTTWVPHLCTAEALWELDVSGANPIKLYDFGDTYSVWNGVGMATWENGGALYVPLGGNPLGQLMEYTREGADRAFRMVGLDRTSWPTARQGRIVGLRSTPRWLLALVRNTGNTECGIWAWDGEYWHHIYNSDTSSGGWPTTGSPVPQAFGVSNVDGTQRLHLVWDNGTNGDACHVKNPLERPLDVSGFVYEAAAYILYPRFGGDALVDTKGFFGIWLVGDSLTATEKATMSYALDGGASFTDLTAHTASGLQRMGTSGVGVSGTTIQPKMTLARGGTTTTKPVIRGLALDYRVKPTRRIKATFQVDIKATADMEKSAGRSQETVIANLETALDSAVLVPFVYGRRASKNVDVLDMPELLGLSRDIEKVKSPEQVGLVTVTVEEL